MSDTPRTDAEAMECCGSADDDSEGQSLVRIRFARKLERELAAALALSEERRAMLEKHQSYYDYVHHEAHEVCPECECAVSNGGHAPGCALARLIKT